MFDTNWDLKRQISLFWLFWDKALLLKTESHLFRYALYCFGSGQRDQIGGDRRQPYVASKRSLPFPRAAVKSQAALDPGDDRFHAGPKAPQAIVDPLTAAHIFHLQPALLGKTHILDLAFFGGRQVGFGSKPAIQGHLQRVAPINLMLSIEHGEGQFGIGRIAIGNHTVGNQVGSPHTKAHLVPIVGLPAVLDDDIGVRFEDRYDLLCGRDTLVLEHPAVGLSDHLAGQIDISFQLGAKANPLKACHALCQRDRRGGISHGFACQLEQISVGRRALSLFLGILHGQHAPLGATAMIGELDPDTALTHPIQDSGQPHTVEKKRGIGGRLDIALHHRAVDANLTALFNFLSLPWATKIRLICSHVTPEMRLMFFAIPDFLKHLSAMPMRENPRSEVESAKWKGNSS